MCIHSCECAHMHVSARTDKTHFSVKFKSLVVEGRKFWSTHSWNCLNRGKLRFLFSAGLVLTGFNYDPTPMPRSFKVILPGLGRLPPGSQIAEATVPKWVPISECMKSLNLQLQAAAMDVELQVCYCSMPICLTSSGHVALVLLFSGWNFYWMHPHCM